MAGSQFPYQQSSLRRARETHDEARPRSRSDWLPELRLARNPELDLGQKVIQHLTRPARERGWPSGGKHGLRTVRSPWRRTTVVLVIYSPDARPRLGRRDDV